jgi:hypothetical protein
LPDDADDAAAEAPTIRRDAVIVLINNLWWPR